MDEKQLRENFSQAGKLILNIVHDERFSSLSEEDQRSLAVSITTILLASCLRVVSEESRVTLTLNIFQHATRIADAEREEETK